MSITIETPTAEAAWQAVQQLPQDELERLKAMLSAPRAETAEEEETAWHEASLQAANRFFDEEETS